jgi:hypothetical protein
MPGCDAYAIILATAVAEQRLPADVWPAASSLVATCECIDCAYTESPTKNPE